MEKVFDNNEKEYLYVLARLEYGPCGDHKSRIMKLAELLCHLHHLTIQAPTLSHHNLCCCNRSHLLDL